MEENFKREWDFKTYQDYYSLSKRKTQHFLMIGELIDNSISSFENEYGLNISGWPEKLKIKIMINMDGTRASNKQKVHEGIEYYPEAYIEVEDNAFGMDQETLTEAVKIGKINTITRSKMNIHGKGLKQSAFYYGLVLNVATKKENQLPSVINIDIANAKKLTDPVHYQPRNSNKYFHYNRGTKIFISYILPNSKITPNAWAQTIGALAERYSRYLASEKVDIEYEYHYDRGREIDQANDKLKDLMKSDEISYSYDVTSGTINFNEIKKIADLSMSFNNTNHKGYEGLIESFEKKYHDFKGGEFRKSRKRNFYFIEDIADEVKDKIIELFKTHEGSKKFVWNMQKMINGQLIKFKFFRIGLKANYGKWRGIKIYEGNRAIYHGPIVPNQQGAYLEWKTTAQSTGSTDNRFGGEMNITDFVNDMTTTEDKSDFIIPADDRNQLNSIIYTNWFVFDIFENVSRPKFNSDSFFDQEKILSKIKSRYIDKNAKININPQEIELDEYKNFRGKITDRFGNIWTFFLNNDQSDTKNKKDMLITREDINLDEHIIKIDYNKEASIWNKADRMLEIDFYSELLFPVLIQLIVMIINLIVQENKIINIKNNVNNISDEGNEHYFEIDGANF